jgi:alkylhydroperoxidase family enzyme
MARVEYSDPAKHNERTRELLGKNRNANIFRMMAHSPSYLEQYCRLGGAIRHKGELDPIVRELAITRTGILCEAPYEIVAHKRIGKNVGVTDEQNEALEHWAGRRPASTMCSAPRSPSPMKSSGVTSRRTRPSTRLPRN